MKPKEKSRHIKNLRLPHSVIVSVHISIGITIDASAITSAVAMITVIVITADWRRVVRLVHIVNVIHNER